MDDAFTRPPWSGRVAGLITAQDAAGERILIATLHASAPARRLAATPELLLALHAAMDPLEQAMRTLAGERMVAALSARNLADEAITHARNGYRANERPERLWTINADLAPAEREANERLLYAVDELHAAAQRAAAVLSSWEGGAAVAGVLESALRKAHTTH